MTPIFVLCVAVMLALALWLVLHPLLRGGAAAEVQRKLAALDRALAEGVLDETEFGRKRKSLLTESGAGTTSRAPVLPALALALVLPLGASLVYVAVGSPQALDPALVAATAQPQAHSGDPGDASAMQMDEAIAGLEQRLEADPDNLDGWMLLARAYKSTQRFADALSAGKRAFDLAPNNTDVVVEYAEVIALNDPQRNIAGESRALLDQVLSDDPTHQRALWLVGISEAQAGNYVAAIARWEALKAQLEPGSEVLAQVESQLAEARSRAGIASAPSVTSPQGEPATPAAAAAGPGLTIEVDIAPELVARLAPTDVLYVFARAAEGPRMPLALQRLPGAKFPLTVTLDDSMSMMPTMKLSSAAQVVVGARVSKTGVANARSGDLEVLSAPLSPATQTAPLKLVISQVVP